MVIDPCFGVEFSYTEPTIPVIYVDEKYSFTVDKFTYAFTTPGSFLPCGPVKYEIQYSTGKNAGMTVKTETDKEFEFEAAFTSPLYAGNHAVAFRLYFERWSKYPNFNIFFPFEVKISPTPNLDIAMIPRKKV